MIEDSETPRNRALLAGRYAIVHRLGKGGMGVVYLVMDRLLGNQLVALKLMNESLIDELGYIERFKREVTLARRLSHPNIVKIFDIGSHGDRNIYYTMEYIEGVDLRQYLGDPSDQPARVADTATILLQVALAMDFAHRQGIIHRDIKPENIMVAKDGEVKIGDFGSARQLTVDKRITPSGKIIGTPHYMPFEVLSGNPADERSDIFSFGVLTYEMLTGTNPFEHETIPALFAVHARNNYTNLKKLPSGLPKEIVDLIETCLEKSPRDRYQNFSEICCSLLDALIKLQTRPRLNIFPDGFANKLLRSPKSKRNGLSILRRYW